MTLGEACEINIGRTPARANPDYWGHGSPWLSIADMSQGRALCETRETVTPLAIREAVAKPAEPGTVLLSFKLSIGKVGIAQRRMYTNEAIAALPIREGVPLDPEYLAWALSALNLRSLSSRAAKGATLNKRTLSTIEISFPPIDEQRRIATILDQADALRAMRCGALRCLDAVAAASFSRLYSDITLKYSSRELREVVSVRSSLVDPTSPEHGHLPHLAPDSIERDAGRILGFQTAAKDGVTSGKYRFSKGDILYSKIRPYLNKVATPDFDGLCSADMYALVVDEALATREYLAFLLRGRAFLNYCESLSNRANIPKLNRKQLLSYQVVLPPLALQVEFSHFIAELTRKQEAMAASHEGLNSLFTSLQSRAFTGRL